MDFDKNSILQEASEDENISSNEDETAGETENDHENEVENENENEVETEDEAEIEAVGETENTGEIETRVKFSKEYVSSDDEDSLEDLLRAPQPAPVAPAPLVAKQKIAAPVIINYDAIRADKERFTLDNSYVIASFDIGIKNLSYCILSYHPELPKGSQFKIHDWQVLDLLSEDTKKMYCGQCHLAGNYYQLNPKQFYCLRHAKQLDPGLKAGLSPTVLCKHRRVDNTTDLEINIEVIRELDKHPFLQKCHEVIMEQQPHKNARMKNLSFMIFSYFVCRGRVDRQVADQRLRNIRFISGKHKLNVYDGPPIECRLKTRYNRNKFFGKAYCRYMIRHDPDQLAFFSQHKKQDDLADSYLQGVWYLQHKFDKKTTKQNE